VTQSYRLAKDLLQFNVAQLLKERTEASRKFNIENAVITVDDLGLVLTAPLSGTIRLVKAAGDVLVTGTLSTVLQLPCTRCLEPVDVPVTIEIEETFVPITDVATGMHRTLPADVDDTTLIDEAHILDLTEVVRQELYVSQPNQVLCRQDCRGLCPRCGQNLNTGQCSCSPVEIDSRWSALLTLKNNL